MTATSGETVVRPNRRRRLPSRGRIAVLVLLTFAALVLVLIPAWAVIVNSFKNLGESRHVGLGLPVQWMAVENYAKVIDKSDFLTGLRNSLLVTVGTVSVVLLLGSMASWVFARSTSGWARLWYLVAVAGLLVPAAIIPSIALLRAIGLQGTHAGLIVFYAAGIMSVVVFIVTGFVRGIPVELEDAARVDGCGEAGVFFRIVLPLLQPILLTAGALVTISVWTEFFGAFLILNGKAQLTLPLGLYYVSSDAVKQTNWNLVFTHVVLVSAPLLAFYFVMQRRLVHGVLGGSLKG
jgi:raffinose/stachyose/melibiose transport system permease protein